ncbi:serpin family protein [Bremerella sp. P1]|uniref:serpin family protein n=1 Tax=Bremerella sp. P1 TaxID=3026424 RepID=UPI0023687DED|nr:serpin family protein [Bremerella sp. P1]WDI43789.1 serpin family protein [Bremerella sp. P1]
MFGNLLQLSGISWALVLLTAWPGLGEEISTQKESPLAIAVNQVGFDLLYALELEKDEDNLVYSPLSVSACLSMLETGARGQTAAELSAATRFNGRRAELAAAWSQLLGELDSDQGDFTLRYAAQLWGATGYDYQPAMLQILREKYRAELFLLDFRSEPEQARREVRQWMQQQTGSQIKFDDAIPISPDTMLLVTSSLYFRDSWTHPFLPQLTREAAFGKTKGKEESAPKVSLMHQIARIRYAENSQCQLVELPYQGERVTFVVVLPKDVDVPQSEERKLSAADLSRLRSDAKEMSVELFLPRFQITEGSSLKQTLNRLGVRTAFSPEADFTPVAGKSNLYLQDIRHQAVIDLNESGTEVAAVTTAFISKSVREADAVFRADHPFLFFVIDDRTDAILLMGKFAKP